VNRRRLRLERFFPLGLSYRQGGGHVTKDGTHGNEKFRILKLGSVRMSVIGLLTTVVRKCP
jgi:hypothetical protein